MKVFLSTAILAAASAQITPARLRSQNLAILPEENAEIDAAKSETWGNEVDFGRFDKYHGFRMLQDGTYLSLSMSLSMSFSMSLSMSMYTGVPTAAPFIAAPDTPSVVPTYYPTTETHTPTTETQAPSPSTHSTQAPTMSKSGKMQKQELFAYSWSIPPEYTGHFEIYQGHAHGPKAMHTDLELIDVFELGTGTAGSGSVFLPREEYTIVVVNQNQTIGFCCNGTQPGWIYFMWGGLEFDKVTGMYQQRKDKDEFVAEFHKNPGKVNVGDDGAYFKFEARL